MLNRAAKREKLGEMPWAAEAHIVDHLLKEAPQTETWTNGIRGVHDSDGYLTAICGNPQIPDKDFLNILDNTDFDDLNPIQSRFSNEYGKAGSDLADKLIQNPKYIKMISRSKNFPEAQWWTVFNSLEEKNEAVTAANRIGRSEFTDRVRNAGGEVFRKLLQEDSPLGDQSSSWALPAFDVKNPVHRESLADLMQNRGKMFFRQNNLPRHPFRSAEDLHLMLDDLEGKSDTGIAFALSEAYNTKGTLGIPFDKLLGENEETTDFMNNAMHHRGDDFWMSFADFVKQNPLIVLDSDKNMFAETYSNLPQVTDMDVFRRKMATGNLLPLETLKKYWADYPETDLHGIDGLSPSDEKDAFHHVMFN